MRNEKHVLQGRPPRNPVKPKIPSFCVISSPSSSISSSFFHCSPAARWRTGRLWMLTLDGRLKGIVPPSDTPPPSLHTGERQPLCFHVLFSSIDHRTHYVCRGPVCQRSGLMPVVQNGEKEKKTRNPRGIKICFASHSLKKRNWPNHRKSWTAWIRSEEIIINLK